MKILSYKQIENLYSLAYEDGTEIPFQTQANPLMGEVYMMKYNGVCLNLNSAGEVTSGCSDSDNHGWDPPVITPPFKLNKGIVEGLVKIEILKKVVIKEKKTYCEFIEGSLEKDGIYIDISPQHYIYDIPTERVRVI